MQETNHIGAWDHECVGKQSGEHARSWPTWCRRANVNVQGSWLAGLRAHMAVGSLSWEVMGMRGPWDAGAKSWWRAWARAGACRRSRAQCLECTRALSSTGPRAHRSARWHAGPHHCWLPPFTIASCYQLPPDPNLPARINKNNIWIFNFIFLL